LRYDLLGRISSFSERIPFSTVVHARLISEGARIKLAMAQKQLAHAENDARIQNLCSIRQVRELTLAVRKRTTGLKFNANR
jgi:hypothetical protein